jgi:hypothetical protein
MTGVTERKKSLLLVKLTEEPSIKQHKLVVEEKEDKR